MKHRRLQELDRSDFEIVDGEPDIRGWDVRNETGNKIGEVEDLIVDAAQKKVRYLLVDLDDNELDLDHRKVLLPIGLAQLHRDDDDVILPGIREAQLRQLPDYDKDHLDAEIEGRICTALGRSSNATTAGGADVPQDFYTHEYYNADNLYKNRLHEATPVQQQRTESEYERGLKLWERRRDGGLLPDNSRSTGSSDEEMTVNERARLEMINNRRRQYEERRGDSSARNRQRKDNSIEGRIRDEGLA